MKCPSISLILSKIFLAYIVYSIYTLSQLFVSPKCEEGKSCLQSFLNKKPPLDLYIFSSAMKYSLGIHVKPLHIIENFEYTQTQNISLSINLPHKIEQNGTLFLHVILLPHSEDSQNRLSHYLQEKKFMAFTTIEMTQYIVPKVEVFNLLDKKSTNMKKHDTNIKEAVAHIKNKVTFSIMTEDIKLPVDAVPVEVIHNLKIIQDNVFLPIVNHHFLQTRYHDLLRVTPQNTTIPITLMYAPISLGKLRLILHFETTINTLKDLGFSEEDIDDVKSILLDTNIYLLGGTFFIAAIHLLFDFLAFKNDINFWRKKDDLVGLSKWATLWRAFSHSVIFLYLLEENSSLLILIPSGIGTIIELWKSKKILRIELSSNGGFLPRIKFNKSANNAAEIKTREFESKSMRYLSYLLYPLIISAAIYSLLYQSHKSWYSWTINSLVNGVYAFGFLFMLPQLFINYKLKSVAHLPWRSFMYKAFNTFIDDVFAFIITMPTVHRIACFRDDVIFLIYLYQRWLYPVDKSRTDTESIVEEPVSLSTSNKKIN